MWGAERTVSDCNCLPQYNYTVPEIGLFLDVRDGGCVRTNNASLPWCIVDQRTCIGKPRLLSDGRSWDSCVVAGDSPLPIACTSCGEVALCISLGG
jgi:hypothetical protein